MTGEHSRELQGKVALITGAAGGIGSEVARLFAAEGARLALLDANAMGLEELAVGLRARGHPVETAVADLSTQAGVREGTRAGLSAYGGHVDVLVANVGRLLAQPFEDLTAADWQQAFDINFFGHVWACQAVLPRMLEQGSGCIVFTGSDQGLQPDDLAPYAVTKAATHCLVKVLARRYGPRGLWVNAVAPGMTRTPLVDILMAQLAEEFGTDRAEAERRELARRGVPLGRLGTPEEVARAILFLATEPFSNGTILNLSGGNVRSVTS
jgi:NAD(P)-dependent dehydrogenase (short-subunit alcohol dehydrogenase family)